MDHNPYAAPRVDVADPQAGTGDVQLATKWQRFANVALDHIIMYVMILVAVVTAAALMVSDPTDPEMLLWIETYSMPISLGVMLSYYMVFEGLFGWTPGKLITGTRVVTEAGTRPGLLQILGRTVSRWVPFEPFSCLGDPPEGWHDRWSGTRVVRTRARADLGPAYSLRDSGELPGPIGLGLSGPRE
jgi:uncharacterized RDD family membrane protein YckC